MTTEIKTKHWPNGKLKSEYSYQNGRFHGTCKGWHENGQLKYESPYQNGNLHGICKAWYENGLLEYEDCWLHDREVTKEEYFGECPTTTISTTLINPDKCNCSIDVIMSQGCQCGGK